MLEAKSVRELSGVVKGKGYRIFEKDNAARIENGQYFYVNEEGQEVQKTLGEKEWFINYEVEHFNSASESVSNRLLENEKKRAASGKLRVCIVSKETYEQMNAGNKLYANYQAFSGSDVMIWGCSKESFSAIRR